MLRPSTTFLIGRKGSGKSTVFQRVQHKLAKDRRAASAYVDIKTVFESARVDPQLMRKIDSEGSALNAERVRELLLMSTFIKATVRGIRDGLSRQSVSWIQRMKDSFTGSTAELFADLDDYLDRINRGSFVDVTGITKVSSSLEDSRQNAASSKAGISVGKEGVTASVELGEEPDATISSKSEYSAVLLREFDIKTLIGELGNILAAANITHLFIFIDDFSELPRTAMETVVDVLLAPLNNWSDELVKLKVAAYPGRVYYGAIDKTKIDEINLDFYDLYGHESIREMEVKAIDFTRRLVETRFRKFDVDFLKFIGSGGRHEDYDVWRQLFFASMGNPRTLGYILFYLYESRVIYGRSITSAAIRDAAKRYRDTTKKRLSHISRSVVFYTKHLPSEQPYIASKSYLRGLSSAPESYVT
jgi:hypothetical protein